MERMNWEIGLMLLTLVSTRMSVAMPNACGPTPESHSTTKHNDKSLATKHNDKSLVFSNLRLPELFQVKDFLKMSIGVDLLDCPNAYPFENCLYSIDLQLPKKDETLRFLDMAGQAPTREALAVVFFGAQDKPNITEFVVGPLPNPTYMRDVTLEKYKGGLPYYRRPVTSKEFTLIFSHLWLVEVPKAPQFFSKFLGIPSERNVSFMQLAPPGFQSGERRSWLVACQDTPGSGCFIHPLGLEILIDHQSLNASQWTIGKVFYNGQYYGSMEELEGEYKANRVNVVKIPNFPQGEEMASLKTRSKQRAAMPLQFEPNGPRYSIKNNQVLFQSWSFAFGFNVHSGMCLFDIRFKGERVAYELSVQEAIALYGSNAPGGMTSRLMDSTFGIGKVAFELVRGVDCPYLATYMDSDHFSDDVKPVKQRNTICIFEHNADMPLRRHFSKSNSGYYGGLPSSVLVIRSISTLGNYDYVFDFLFYQNGAIESRVHATGYIQSSFYFADGLNYGNRLGEHTLGTLHTHAINYKVDLDVAGTENHVVAHDMEFEAVKAPWSKEHTIHRPKLTRKVLETENQASFKLDAKMPRYMQFASKKTNKWGHERSYRLQMVSFAGDYLPEDSTLAGAMSWAKYKLAITQRKEEEPQSGSIYNQNDPWTPSVKFDDFINDENIVDKDLVAWPTIGFLHIPHAEDIPNTVTTGNGVGFLLRPYNYFKEDPSVDSGDAVYFTKDMDLTSCAVNPLACLSKTASCAPNIPPFNYTGLDNAQLTL